MPPLDPGRAGNAAWSALTLLGHCLTVPCSPCFPSYHDSHPAILPYHHTSYLAILPCLTVPISANIMVRGHHDIIMDEWMAKLFIRVGCSEESPFLAREPDLKGIFGMKAFCQETRQDSGHSQAARSTRQGSGWTASMQT